MAIRSTAYISEHRKRRKKVRLYIWGTLALFALYFIFFGVAALVARSPLFRVEHITVQGNNVIASSDIITLLQADPSGHRGFFDAVLGWNNMLAWPDVINQNQLNMLPQLATVSIHKNYFSRTITIEVTERNPFGVWCFSPNGTAGDTCYWFDDAGVLFEKAINTEGNLIVIVRDYSQGIRGLNENVLPDDFTPHFISIVNVLRKAGIGIQEIDLNNLALEEVDVVTTGGPKIYFSLRFPADDYFGVLQSLVSSSGFSKLQYIDCRTEDRVYYK